MLPNKEFECTTLTTLTLPVREKEQVPFILTCREQRWVEYFWYANRAPEHPTSTRPICLSL